MLANDLALALDPARVMAGAGLPPDPWQADLLRARSDNVLMLCARQTGKSTVTAALALHEAIYYPPALVLLLSPSLRQSQELFRKVVDFWLMIDQPGPIKATSALRMEWQTGSRIISLPGDEKTVRGYSGVSLLVIDEAARVLDDLYYSVRPMLAVSGGRLLALTTPRGKRGWFYFEWHESQNDWQRVMVTAEDCPRISAEFLAEERAAMGDWWYRQEYMCEFVDLEDQIFSYDEVMAAISADVEPLFEVAT